MVSEKTEKKEVKADSAKSKTEKKRLLQVDFTGKELLNNEVFDTTIENVAKEQNIFNEKKKYGVMTIIPGEKDLLDKVEKELMTMKEGEEKTVSLGVKDGFGERQADLVRILPAKVFAEQKINPIPGLVINVGNALGKVQSVSGGRVRVDFNHPLAGRELEYTIRVVKEIKTKKAIADKIFEKYYSQVPDSKKEIKEEILYITLPSDTMKGLEKVNDAVKDLAKDLGVKITFKEAKEKKEETKTEIKKEESKE